MVAYIFVLRLIILVPPRFQESVSYSYDLCYSEGSEKVQIHV